MSFGNSLFSSSSHRLSSSDEELTPVASQIHVLYDDVRTKRCDGCTLYKAARVCHWRGGRWRHLRNANGCVGNGHQLCFDDWGVLSSNTRQTCTRLRADVVNIRWPYEFRFVHASRVDWIHTRGQSTVTAKPQLTVHAADYGPLGYAPLVAARW